MVSDLLTMGRARSLDDIESNQEYRSSTWCDWTFVVLCSIVGYTCIVLTVLACFNPELIHFDISSWLFCKEISPFFAFSQGNGHYSKPQGFKIVALVPFHYHERTAILECYLQVCISKKKSSMDQNSHKYREIWPIMMGSLIGSFLYRKLRTPLAWNG